jgi:hypothetical protein
LLDDHRIGDHAVLPTVCALSWMVDAAALALDIDARLFSVAIKSYRLFKGVVFDGTEPDVLVIESNGAASADDLSVSVKVSSIKANGKPQFHYGCDVSFMPHVVLSEHDACVPDALKVVNNINCYSNGTLFHRDSLQGLSGFEIFESEAWFSCHLPESVKSKASGFDLSQASSNVFANDLIYQAMLVWVRETLGLGSLPSTTKSWELFQAPVLHGAFYIQLSDIKVQGNSIKAAASVVNDENQLLAKVIGCEVMGIISSTCFTWRFLYSTV